MNPKGSQELEKKPYSIWNLFSLDRKIAMVTGGASGLGYFFALALAEAGADVAITSRVLEKAKTSADAIQAETGKKILPIELDVTVEKDVERAVDEVLAEFEQLNILVNNAGDVKPSTPEAVRFENRSLGDWQEVIDVNLTGTFLCTRHAATKYMMPANSGRVINIGSIAGITGRDRRMYDGTDKAAVPMDYSAAKGGVINLTRDLAAYLGSYNILVNCISPGAFWRESDPTFEEAYSEATMLGRMGREDTELGGAVVFLASEASTYITGHNLVVDGGYTAW